MVDMLYAWHYQEILGYLRSLTQGGAQAEDLAQDTFMRAMAHADQLITMDGPACRAWLYRTARNLLIDSARRQKLEAACAPPTLNYEQDFSPLFVHEALSALTREDQAIFRLRHFDGYNATQIGDLLGLPAATVRTRLARARQTLKEALAEDQGKETTP